MGEKVVQGMKKEDILRQAMNLKNRVHGINKWI